MGRWKNTDQKKKEKKKDGRRARTIRCKKSVVK